MGRFQSDISWNPAGADHTGKGPRDFNIIDDRYIVVASQEDDRLELYTFDEEKEEIKPTGNTLDIIQPVCVAL